MIAHASRQLCCLTRAWKVGLATDYADENMDRRINMASQTIPDWQCLQMSDINAPTKEDK
jgi:hypothetical protein